MPVVSFVMGTYNAHATVGRAIESILGQTCPDWELRIVDDGSTDNSWELLSKFAESDSRIFLKRSASNRGLAATLNSAWVNARGSLIARMDADDFSLPMRLERQVEFMARHAEVAVLGSGAELLDEHGRFAGIAYRPCGHDELASRIYRENPFIHPSVIIRRSFLEALQGYDPRLRRGQDYDLWLRGYRSFRYANLREPLIRYRRPRLLSPAAVLYGMFVLFRAGIRDRRALEGLVSSTRYGSAALLTRAGIYRSELRR